MIRYYKPVTIKSSVFLTGLTGVFIYEMRLKILPEQKKGKCRICGEFSEKLITYHIIYSPLEVIIPACQRCNYLEHKWRNKLIENPNEHEKVLIKKIKKLRHIEMNKIYSLKKKKNFNAKKQKKKKFKKDFKKWMKKHKKEQQEEFKKIKKQFSPD